MITAGHLAIQFEHNIPKMEMLSSSCIALTAGSITHTEIFEIGRREIEKLKDPSIHEIADIIKNQYIAEKKTRAEDSILKHRGLNIYDVYGGKLPIELLVRLDSEIDDIRIQLEVLVCGVDSKGGHIYYIRDVPSGMRMGMIDCYDRLGYMAIGSGSPHAVTTLISSRFVPTFSLNQALYLIYEAKRAAEVAPGVGEDTDINIITINQIQRVAESTMIKLKEIYDKKIDIINLPKSELNESIKELVIEYENK